MYNLCVKDQGADLCDNLKGQLLSPNGTKKEKGQNEKNWVPVKLEKIPEIAFDKILILNSTIVHFEVSFS